MLRFSLFYSRTIGQKSPFQVAHTCNPSIREAETAGFFVGGQPGNKGRSLDQQQQNSLSPWLQTRLYQPWCVRTHQTYSVIAVIKPKEALSHD